MRKTYDRLQISYWLRKELPADVMDELDKMRHNRQLTFEINYLRRRLSFKFFLLYSLVPPLLLMYPLHFRLLKLQSIILPYWLSLGGLGMWYAFEVFYTPIFRVRFHNNIIARELLKEIKLAGDTDRPGF